MSDQPGVLYATSALRSPTEEFLGALTHGIGLLLSIVGAAGLMAAAIRRGDLAFNLGCGFYAATLVAVYAASTLSHLYLPEQLNRFFRSLDQGFIYLLIVGTFTPFALTYLRTPAWLLFYALTLTFAFAGFLSKTMFAYRLDGTGVWLYVALGWGEGLAVKPMLGQVPAASLYWVVAGGLCYTIGAAFLVLDIRKYHFHAIWHVLVIAGSACHYAAIMQVVAA